MDRLVKGLIVLGVIVCVVSAGFFLYANFLVDYTLENLEIALGVTSNDPLETTPIQRTVYQGIVNDLVFEETSDEDFNAQHMAFLALASRSMGEASARAGYERARIYLEEVVEQKRAERGVYLRFFDQIFRMVIRFYQTGQAFVAYGWRRITGQESITKPPVMSSILLLIQAQDKESRGEFAEAADLYRNYLKLHPSEPDLGFVQLALSQLLIRSRKYHEAKEILRQIQFDFTGSHESMIASRLIKKIGLLKDREFLIKQIEALLPGHEGTPRGELLKLKLGIAYYATYQFKRAEEVLSPLQTNEDSLIRQRAKFYLASVYKATKQLGASAKLLADLLDDPDLEKELGLGLRAELADIYYQQRDVQKSLEQYAAISEEIGEDIVRQSASFQAWAALAELEQANIYYFDLDDSEEARLHLGRLEGLIEEPGIAGRLENTFDSDVRVNLRKQAFQALRQGKVHWAHDLFKKHLVYYPEDAWAYGGLATVYLLFGEMELAMQNAQKAYDLKADEYTTSVRGYLYGLRGEYRQAVAMYLQALAVNPDYIAARFNIACMYLELELYQPARDFLIKLDRDFEALESNYMHSKILNNLGYTMWWLGDRNQAVSNFQKALNLTPDFSIAEKNLAQVALGEAPQMVTSSGIE